METTLKIASSVRYRVIDDEAVVIRQCEGDVLVLNQVAARVVQLVDEGLSPHQIADQLVNEFEAPEAAIRKDVDHFLGELENLKVVERIPAAGDAP